MQELNPNLIEADAVVFVSPIYYYGINAQIKAVIDRFYANDKALHNNKKAVLMITFADDSAKTANGAVETFKGMTDFLGWEISGIIAAQDCAVPERIKNTDYPKQAYELGKNI